MIWLLFLIVSILCGPFVSANASAATNEPALLVVSYDAFRPDYLNRNVTPNLNRLRREGSSAKYMVPVFPTKTYVNHFSIVTGLYPGTHGVLANSLYDSEYGKLGYSYELFHYANNTIPIWTANEMAGKHSGCMWPGGDYEYNGVNCTFARSFNASVKFEERIDTIMTWFTDKKTPANLVLLYVEEPDAMGHIYGPESDRITETIARVDNVTRYIQDKLIANNLKNRVNVIHLSDHGMIGVTPPKFIDLTKFIDKGHYDIYGSSPILQIVPKNPRMETEIFVNFTKAAEENGHFKVYNQNNLPERWHAKNERRMGPIITVADVGYGFQDLMDEAIKYKKLYNVTITNETQYGVHGYDNAEPSMHAMFIANGPIFAKGKVFESINVIDLYSLFCSILDIKCGKTDGITSPYTWNKMFTKQFRSNVHYRL